MTLSFVAGSALARLARVCAQFGVPLPRAGSTGSTTGGWALALLRLQTDESLTDF